MKFIITLRKLLVFVGFLKHYLQLQTLLQNNYKTCINITKQLGISSLVFVYVFINRIFEKR